MKPDLHPERLRARRQTPTRMAVGRRTGGPVWQGGGGFASHNLGQT
ncbi:MAG: hypothetical protein QE486_07895 [Burkholderiaceae bacterium]|nr:hypothetical protein [Burkholderiaceae bacterium]